MEKVHLVTHNCFASAACLPYFVQSKNLVCWHKSHSQLSWKNAFQACTRCGATSTPLWRPEVPAGPKILCNACGVKALYSIKAKKARPENGLSVAAKLPHTSPAPQQSHMQTAPVPSNKRPRIHHDRRDTSPAAIKGHQEAAAQDVILYALQKQYLEVERHYDATGRNIVRWTITDRTIEDRRDFDQLMHAQAFVNECWFFMSATLMRCCSPYTCLPQCMLLSLAQGCIPLIEYRITSFCLLCYGSNLRSEGSHYETSRCSFSFSFLFFSFLLLPFLLLLLSYHTSLVRQQYTMLLHINTSATLSSSASPQKSVVMPFMQ